MDNDRKPQDQASDRQIPHPGQQQRQAEDPSRPNEPNPAGLSRKSPSPAQGIETGSIQPGKSGDGTAEQI